MLLAFSSPPPWPHSWYYRTLCPPSGFLSLSLLRRNVSELRVLGNPDVVLLILSCLLAEIFELVSRIYEVQNKLSIYEHPHRKTQICYSKLCNRKIGHKF